MRSRAGVELQVSKSFSGMLICGFGVNFEFEFAHKAHESKALKLTTTHFLRRKAGITPLLLHVILFLRFTVRPVPARTSSWRRPHIPTAVLATMNAPSLPEALQAFAQILMKRERNFPIMAGSCLQPHMPSEVAERAKKVVSNEDAWKALEASYERFKGDEIDLEPAISKVDKTLSFIDMGVRSMKATGPDGVIYHCVVNKIPDEVAKLHGSKLTEWQVEAFKAIIAMFGTREDEQLRLPELQGEIKSRQKNMTNEMISTFAEQLVEDFWLARPHNNAGYRLGVRSLVELPELLKSYNLSVPQVIYH